MKKILCLLLIGVICMGLGGCMGGLLKAVTDVPEREQKAMLKHLEEKYGEKFVIKEIHIPQNESSFDRGATVYPEGREDESFYVNLGAVGSKKCVDDYVLRKPEKRMTPLYEEWIQDAIPSAKVAVRLNLGTRAPEIMYDANKTLQQFVNEAKDISIEVNVMLSESMLESKDEVFEKLSKLPESEPISGYWSNSYNIGFFTQEAFDSIKSGEYKHIPSYLKPFNDEDKVKETGKDLVAVSCFVHITENNRQQYEILKQLNDDFEIKEEAE